MGNFTEIEKVYEKGKEGVSHCSMVTRFLLKLVKRCGQQRPQLHYNVRAVTANELYA